MRYWRDAGWWSAPAFLGDGPANIAMALSTVGESGVGEVEWRTGSHSFNWPQAASTTTKPSNPKDIVGVRKAPMSTVSGAVLAEVGVAMLEGACKYGRHNYRAVGVRSSVYYDATMRHLFGWWEGEDTDPDSGLSHITKAIASLVVLRDAMLQDKVVDDRPPRAKTFYPGLNARAAVMVDKHADKSPHHYTEADGGAASGLLP
jgi:hypothetical protein